MAFNANLANAFLAAPINNTATSISLQTGQGANMPTTLPYKLTLVPFGQLPTKLNSEIILVTARSTDTITVTRGVGGTTARSFSQGDIISNGVYIENSTAIGDISISLRATPEAGRLFMDGATYTKVAYPLLYQFVINNPAYGTTVQTPGSETFTLADMRERMPFGKSGNAPFTTLGAKGGAATHTLTIGEMPAHNHGGALGVDTGGDFGIYGGGASGKGYSNPGPGIWGGSVFIRPDGGGQPHNNMSPYIIVNYEVIAG